jgi:hypothetical protein
MLTTLRQILEGALERLNLYATNILPPLLAALVVLLIAYAAALSARWLLYKIFKGTAIDKFLRQSGVAFMLDRSGRLRATRIMAEAVFWGFLLAGIMTGLSIFDTNLTTQMLHGVVFLLPKLFTAGIILLAGAWLSLYLGRSLLVWAVNEDLPSPRRIAMIVRVLIVFVAVVVAADQLDFAKSVFLAAFIILVGGVVLTGSLALGIGAAHSVKDILERKRRENADDHERSLRSHV